MENQVKVRWLKKTRRRRRKLTAFRDIEFDETFGHTRYGHHVYNIDDDSDVESDDTNMDGEESDMHIALSCFFPFIMWENDFHMTNQNVLL